MHKIARWTAAALAGLALTGCGQTGPSVADTPEPTDTTAVTAQAITSVTNACQGSLPGIGIRLVSGHELSLGVCQTWSTRGLTGDAGRPEYFHIIPGFCVDRRRRLASGEFGAVNTYNGNQLGDRWIGLPSGRNNHLWLYRC